MAKLYTFGPVPPRGIVYQTLSIYREFLEPPFSRSDMIRALQVQFPRANYEVIKDAVDADIALGMVVGYEKL